MSNISVYLPANEHEWLKKNIKNTSDYVRGKVQEDMKSENEKGRKELTAVSVILLGLAMFSLMFNIDFVPIVLLALGIGLAFREIFWRNKKWNW